MLQARKNFGSIAAFAPAYPLPTAQLSNAVDSPDGSLVPGHGETLEPRRARSKVHQDYKIVAESDAEYDKGLVKSAQRALQVFEFFTECGRPAVASEIAANLDLPQSSTSLLLRTLVKLGYLEFDRDNRTFWPSLRMSLVGGWQPRRADHAGQIMATMRGLNAMTGECVLLAEQYRHFVRYIYVVQKEDPEKLLYVPVGTLRPICSTAAGQVLLSQMPAARMRAIIHAARSDPECDDYGVSPAKVEGDVAQASSAGFALTSRPMFDQQSFQIAAAVPPSEGSPALAIGLLCYGARFSDRQDSVIRTLVGQAAQIGTAPPAP